MSTTNEQLQSTFEEFLKEDAKFTGGNSAAGTRSRKALAELSKLIKVRRNEITEEKNTRKEAKTAPAAATKKVAVAKKAAKVATK
jgi:Histone H1-like protein Hc1